MLRTEAWKIVANKACSRGNPTFCAKPGWGAAALCDADRPLQRREGAAGRPFPAILHGSMACMKSKHAAQALALLIDCEVAHPAHTEAAHQDKLAEAWLL